MTNWESSLNNIATGTNWDLDSAVQVSDSLKQLQDILSKVSGDTGFTGTTGLEASTSLGDARTSLNELIEWLDDKLPKALDKANEARADAAKALGELGAGSLSQDQTNAIRAAEVGATLVFGPISVVVGEGAIAAANAFFGNQRENQAHDAYRAASDKIDQARDELTDPPQPSMSEQIKGHTDGGDGGGTPAPHVGGSAGPRSYEQHPDFGAAPPPTTCEGYLVVDPDGTVRDEDGETGEIIDWYPYQPETPILMPTPDGPIGNGLLHLPTGPGGGGLGTGGLGGGGLGSGGLGGGGGLGSGLMVGAGGGAAMAGMAKLAALRGGAGGALGALGGRGGLTPNAGGAGARAGGTGGLLGGRGGAGAGVAGEGAGAGRPGGAGMMGGGGAPGGAGGKNDKRGRGLGGPIAPTMEDDEEFGPRSENAGAGGRD